MSEDSDRLEAEYNSLLKEKIEEMKAEKAAAKKLEADKLAKEKEDALKEQIRADVTAELNKKVDVGIDTGGKMTKEKSDDVVNFAKSYIKKHKITAPAYGSSDWLEGLKFEAETSNSGCEYDLDDWTKEGVFADVIWQSFYCKGYLAGKVTVRGIDFEKGEGCKVMIRTVGKRTAQGPLSACECLSCATNAFGRYEIELSRYGDFTTVCELDIFCTGDEVKNQIIEAMSSGLAEAVDSQIYSALEEAAAGFVETTSGCCGRTKDSCCQFAFDVYDSIIALDARMRKAGRNPDYVIMDPTIAAYFKYRESSSKISYPIDSSISDGVLTRIGRLKVIEFPCANECDSEATDSVVAILIDSSRAVGEAWGKRPIIEQERNIQCNSIDIAMHMYLGIKALDVSAIGHIKTPSTCT